MDTKFIISLQDYDGVPTIIMDIRFSHEIGTHRIEVIEPKDPSWFYLH